VPIAGPNQTFRASKCGANDRVPIRAVRLAPIILAPCRFICVLKEQVTADPMMLADLRAAEPREIRLGLINVRAVLGLVLDRVVDPPHVVGRVQAFPGGRFVGMDDWSRMRRVCVSAAPPRSRAPQRTATCGL
jgi:hypothetical protein